MAKTVVISGIKILSFSVAPTSANTGAYRFNTKYAVVDISGSDVYRKEATYYSSNSGLSPLLPVGLENLINTFMSGSQVEFRALEEI